MKVIFGILIFVFVFALAGVGMHYGIYSKPGIFIWSLDEQNRLVQTKLQAVGVEVVTLTRNNPDETGGEPAKVSEAEVAEKGKGAGKSDAPAEPEVKEVEEPEIPLADREMVELFDGKELGLWEVTQYGGEGDVFVTEEGELEFGFGAILTGVHWGEETPRLSNYEISLEAMKLDGTDFFCALTFPVKQSHATFVIGGWGGGIVGLSSVDDLDASENETMNIEGFDENVWFKIRVRVTEDKIEAWIDEDQMVDLDLKDRKISLRPGDIELSVPMGIASFQTRAKYRNIVWKNLPKGE